MSLSSINFTDAQGSAFTAASMLTFNRRSQVQNIELIAVSTEDYTTETTTSSARDFISFNVWYWPSATSFGDRASGADPYELMHPTSKQKTFTFEPDPATYDTIIGLEAKCDYYLENVLIPEINAITQPT